MMPRLLTLLAGLLIGTLALRAADLPAPLPAQVQRAEKIVTGLNLTDAGKAARVRDIIARQYADLGAIHSVRDAALKAAKAQAATDKPGAEAASKQARATAETAQVTLHREFLTRLAAELSPAQIDQVKDGLTYGVLPLTFRVYQEMLPTLTAEQKAQILAWLTEARELAMDGSTSEEKHGVFGKYKGRINNYLAKAGYDMKQAEKQMLAKQTPAAK
jgi:hypothetical protein